MGVDGLECSGHRHRKNDIRKILGKEDLSRSAKRNVLCEPT